MQTPDEKRFRDMQEHPEKYSDQELEAMMDDLDQMADADVAWQEFCRQHAAVRSSRRWLQTAAVFAGVLLFSGIAFAAIHIWSHSPGSSTMDEASSCILTSDTIRQATPVSHRKEGGEEAIVTFNNVSLDSILTEMAAYYHYSVELRNEEKAHTLRLFFRWARQTDIERVVEELNSFEHIHITVDDKKLIAE